MIKVVLLVSQTPSTLPHMLQCQSIFCGQGGGLSETIIPPSGLNRVIRGLCAQDEGVMPPWWGTAPLMYGPLRQRRDGSHPPQTRLIPGVAGIQGWTQLWLWLHFWQVSWIGSFHCKILSFVAWTFYKNDQCLPVWIYRNKMPTKVLLTWLSSTKV